jgi:hypothetical protein
MGGATPSQALRFPYIDDVISESAQGNLGTDVAAKLTTQDTARSLVLKKPFVYLQSGTSTADGTDTTLVLASPAFDSYGLWSAGNPTRITVGSGNTGLWKFSLLLSYSAGVGITRVQLSVLVTGTARAYRTFSNNTSGPSSFTFCGMQQVTTGTDYLEFKVQHNGGGTQAVTASVMAWQASA